MNSVPSIDALFDPKGSGARVPQLGSLIFKAKARILVHYSVYEYSWFESSVKCKNSSDLVNRHYTEDIYQISNHGTTLLLSFVFLRRWALCCAGLSQCWGLWFVSHSWAWGRRFSGQLQTLNLPCADTGSISR